MRKIEQLLGKVADDKESDLDEVHVQQLCHVLRAQGGAHGRELADKLIAEVDTTPAAPPAPPA